MKNKKLFEILQKKETLSGIKGIKIAYAINKNIKLVKDEVEALQASLIPSDGYKKFDEDRIAIAKKYCKKDENGKEIVNNDNFVFEGDNQDKAEKEFKELQKKHENDIEERKKSVEEYNKMLDEECNVAFHKFPEIALNNDITVGQLELIEDWIDDKK